MKLLFITYVCCFFVRTAEVEAWYTIRPGCMDGHVKPPQCVRLPEKEYVIGFLVIHQTR